MPGEAIVATENELEGAGSGYVIMPPQHSVSFEINDPSQSGREILLVHCLKSDRGSDVFVIPEPEEDLDELGYEEILERYCTEENFLVQVDEETGCHVDAYDWDGDPLELVIGHHCIMSLS